MKRRLSIALALLAACIATAKAETYPSRPITIVVPYPAGGPSDTLARILADHMNTSLGQPFIIENVAGGGGSIGVGRVARAAPDGYTVSIGHWNTHVVLGATMDLPYDVLNDFEPVALLADTPIWMVASNALPPKNLTELIAWLKQNPGKATAGTVGVGGASDITGAYFQGVTGTKFLFVPYRGAAPLIRIWLPVISISIWAWQRPAIRSCAADKSRPMPRWLNPDGGLRLTFQRWRRPAFRDSTRRSGMGYGCRREHPMISSQNSIPRCGLL